MKGWVIEKTLKLEELTTLGKKKWEKKPLKKKLQAFCWP